jgi:hypothetical protein
MSEEEKPGITEQTIREYAELHGIPYEQALKEALEKTNNMEYEEGKVSRKGVEKLIDRQKRQKEK